MRWTKPSVLAVALIVLSGCSTSKDKMLPPGDSTMLELWNAGASTTHAAHEGRTTLRRPLNGREQATSEAVAESYSRTQENEIQQIFSATAQSGHGDVCLPASRRRQHAGAGLQHGISILQPGSVRPAGERTEDL